jgi:hypothetical protein
VQAGGDGLTAELLDPLVQLACLRRAAEDRCSEFGAH